MPDGRSFEGQFVPHSTIEQESLYSSKIDMRFFRHDDKAKGANDFKVTLTPEGKQHAKAQATLKNTDQAVAFGSPRQRTQETAGFILGGKSDEINGDETLEELKAKLDAERAYGSKIGVDTRLNFDIDMASEFGGKAVAALKRGEFLKFMVEESDTLAAELQDTESSTYSRQASNIASIIEKYLTIAPRFDNLVQEKGLDKNMQRLMGSHQGVTESFLAKVIDKTAGKAERDAFVQSLGNQGFGFSEGFSVEIKTKEAGQEPSVHVRFHKTDADGKETFAFDQDVPLSVIREIVEEK